MKVVFFLNISIIVSLIFQIFYFFFIFVNKHFINKGTHISKSKRCYNAKPSAYYFYMRTNIPLNFCIWIIVPLNYLVCPFHPNKIGIIKGNIKSGLQKTKWFKPAIIIFIIFWDFLIFYQIFLSPQVKRCAISTYKHNLYELPHELSNDLKLRKT